MPCVSAAEIHSWLAVCRLHLLLAGCCSLRYVTSCWMAHMAACNRPLQFPHTTPQTRTFGRSNNHTAITTALFIWLAAASVVQYRPEQGCSSTPHMTGKVPSSKLGRFTISSDKYFFCDHKRVPEDITAAPYVTTLRNCDASVGIQQQSLQRSNQVLSKFRRDRENSLLLTESRAAGL
jgi:hypothetical protein